MRRHFHPLVLAVMAVLSTGPPEAVAQTACGPRKDVITHLGQNFGEVPQAIALTDFGSVLEVLVSPQGTWTMIVTTVRGQACVIATGQHWQSLAVKDEPAA